MPMLPWYAELDRKSRGARHRGARCCAATRSTTRTSGRCGCTSRPGYDDDTERRYAAVYVIQGYTGHVAMWANRTPFRQPFVETADAVFARGEAPPADRGVRRRVDRLWRSQFVDSPGTGAYHSYLCDEVVPFVDARYRTMAEPAIIAAIMASPAAASAP